MHPTNAKLPPPGLRSRCTDAHVTAVVCAHESAQIPAFIKEHHHALASSGKDQTVDVS